MEAHCSECDSSAAYCLLVKQPGLRGRHRPAVASVPVGWTACKLVVSAIFRNPSICLFSHTVHDVLLRGIVFVQGQGRAHILQDAGLQEQSDRRRV